MDSISRNRGNVAFGVAFKVEVPGKKDPEFVNRCVNELGEILRLQDEKPDTFLSKFMDKEKAGKIRKNFASKTDYVIPQKPKSNYFNDTISSYETTNGDTFVATGPELEEFNRFGVLDYKDGQKGNRSSEVYKIMKNPESRIKGNKKLVIFFDTWKDGTFKTIKKIAFRADKTDY